VGRSGGGGHAPPTVFLASRVLPRPPRPGKLDSEGGARDENRRVLLPAEPCVAVEQEKRNFSGRHGGWVGLTKNPDAGKT